MGWRTLYENNNRIISMSIFLMHFVSFIKKDKARKRKKCIAEIYKKHCIKEVFDTESPNIDFV